MILHKLIVHENLKKDLIIKKNIQNKIKHKFIKN